MDLKNYAIDKFEKYYFENKKAVNIQDACYLYMDKNNLLEILKDREFFKVDEHNYGLVKWLLIDICKIFNGTGFFEVINVKELAQKTYGMEIKNINGLMKSLKIIKEQWKFGRVDFKELLDEYNIDYKLDLISDENDEKSIITELEEEIIAEKRVIKRLEEKLREQELFKINIELNEIIDYFDSIEKLSLNNKISRYLGSREEGFSIEELFNKISLLEDITKDKIELELKSSKLFVENEDSFWTLRNRELGKIEINMKELIEIIESYVQDSSSKLLKQSWSIFKEYNFTKEEVSLQKIGERYGYTRDYTFQLHNMSIEIFEQKKINEYLKLYISNIENTIREERFIKIKSDSYKKLFGQWNTKKFINFINKFGLDLILTDNKYIMSRSTYEEYLLTKKEKNFRSSRKKIQKKGLAVVS